MTNPGGKGARAPVQHPKRPNLQHPRLSTSAVATKNTPLSALVFGCFSWMLYQMLYFRQIGDEPDAITYHRLIAEMPMISVAEAYGSRTHPRRRGPPRNGFEDRETHRDPYTSTAYSLMRCSAASMACRHAGRACPHIRQYLSQASLRSHERRRSARLERRQS